MVANPGSSTVADAPALPPEEAVSILVLSVDEKTAARRYRSIYEKAGLPSFSIALTAAEEADIVRRSGDQSYMVGQAGAFVRSVLREWPTGSATEKLRAACAARLLREPPAAAVFPVLKNIGAVLAAISAHLVGGGQSGARVGQTTKRVIDAATRTIVERALKEAFAAFETSVSVQAKPISDELLLRLRNAVLGSPDPIEGFVSIVESKLNLSLGGSVDSRWKALLVFSAKSSLMASPAFANQQALEFVDRLYSAVQRASATSPTGWAAIYDAYEAMEGRKVPLADFKAELRAAAREDIVELSPISVSSLMPEAVKARSELEVGGLKFHYVRMSRRMART